MAEGNKRALVIIGGLISTAIILAGAAAGYHSYVEGRDNPMTDDASVEAEINRMAAGVPGRIKAMHVRENATVAAGDLLFELDATAYELAVAQAQADLEMAQAAARDRTRGIAAERANAEIAIEQVERARNNLELATQSYERLVPLEARGFVSQQQLDDARTLKLGAEVSLREAERQREAAEALIGDAEATAARIRAREAALALARHELSQTLVRAPEAGRIVGLTANDGDYVLPAQTLFSLIRTDEWFVNASFTETTLSRISAGACATIFVLSDRSVPIRGVVESVGWGVASPDLINLPVGLPIVPRSLDWVRVQQRFPVRIRLTDPPPDLMRVGASVIATVHAADDDC